MSKFNNGSKKGIPGRIVALIIIVLLGYFGYSQLTSSRSSISSYDSSESQDGFAAAGQQAAAAAAAEQEAAEAKHAAEAAEAARETAVSATEVEVATHKETAKAGKETVKPESVKGESVKGESVKGEKPAVKDEKESTNAVVTGGEGKVESADTDKVSAEVLDGYDAANFIEEIVRAYPLVLFTKSRCPFSINAKKLFLDVLHVEPAPFIYDLDVMPHFEQNFDYLKQSTGRQTVPNIFVGGKSRGGFSEFEELGSKLEAKLAEWSNGKVTLPESE